MDAPLNGKNTVNDLIDRINDLTVSVDTVTEGAISGPGIAVTDKLVSFADTTGQILKQATNVSDFAYILLDDANQGEMQTTLGIKSAGLLDATPNNTANQVVQRDSSGNFSANLITSAVRGQSSREFYSGADGLYHWHDVAGYINGGSSVTGTMKITLPVGWTNTMMSIIIRGYNQMGQGGAYEYTISGYNASPWTRRAAEVSGNVPTVLPIRFGFDGTKACILIGDVTTAWAYPRLAITDVITSYAGANTGWDAGWVIAPITDETGIAVSGAAYPNIVVHAASLELGSQANEPSNAVVDFHTGSTSVDYDSRIIGISGTGNGTNGSGTLHIVAAEVNMATGAGLTQVVKVNTQPADTNSQVVASTAFVLGQGSTVNPLMDGVAAPGTSLRFSKADHVHPADTTKAPLASPALTGVPTAPTAALNTNTTQVATTAYVIGQAANVVSPMNGVAAVGTSTRFARQDHVHTSDTTKVNTSTLGVANGVATLDATGLVPTTQLPAYVDDVLEFANLAAFPASGTNGKIYVALDTNKTYRWSGSVYVYITSGAVDSVAGKTGVVTLVKGDVGLGSVDNTSDANKPVSTAQQSALDLKAPLASPALTGVPTAPTAAVGTSTTQVATTAFVNAEIANDAPTKTGGGASGSWPISVTGNAARARPQRSDNASWDLHWNDPGGQPAYYLGSSDGAAVQPYAIGVMNVGSATQLQTARTINGVEFNGTSNIVLPAADGTPAGAVMAFARSSAPSGWLKANGAAVSRTSYAALFAAIGTTFGAGDGSTTFNLPDLRGEFLRGWDDARGVDPGRGFGTWQDSDNKSHAHTASTGADAHTHTWSGTTSSDGAHTHTLGGNLSATGTGSNSFQGRQAIAYTATTSTNGEHTHTISGTTSGASHTHTVTVNGAGGVESRPRNCALLMCIKF